ncbi:hypothetical protein Y032_0332g2785 [Ancylostoma ceylanicum]|uniref:Uncharacterized protein n=1 Tax=Ancylostoma ceylanicum TaxID=53326 RepID=A0A016RZ69_9BILA|nr:hypothetical protein Y032_0332g2785 [Ancylostoma ceylanicum]
MSAETAEEGIQKYRNTKRIFNELKMNLREFMSNDESVNRSIPLGHRAEDRAPKVLGMKEQRQELRMESTAERARSENKTSNYAKRQQDSEK